LVDGVRDQTGGSLGVQGGAESSGELIDLIISLPRQSGHIPFKTARVGAGEREFNQACVKLPLGARLYRQSPSGGLLRALDWPNFATSSRRLLPKTCSGITYFSYTNVSVRASRRRRPAD
jgi:hypothetical protein